MNALTYGHIQANLADIDKYLRHILNAIEWAQLDQMLLSNNYCYELDIVSVVSYSLNFGEDFVKGFNIFYIF